MSSPKVAANGLDRDQARATDPKAHAALSASAGTGKTHVLTSRVFRLLLGGANPESILCLTFTKSGAAAMAQRVNERLARWVRLSGPELAKELEGLGERTGPDMRDLARQLFARVLDAPGGGIRIQTIHGFAQSLLAAFPAEAEITPGFKPIEGRAADELAMRTLAELAADADERGDERLIADIAVLSRRLGEAGAVDYLKLCAGRPDAIETIDPVSVEARIRSEMGIPDCDVESFLADRCADGAFDCDLLRAIAAANRAWGTKTGLPHVDAIETWLAMAPAKRAATLDLLYSVVFTSSGSPRKVQGQIRHDPDYQTNSDRLAEIVSELLAVQAGCALAADMAAGLRAGQAFSVAYSRAKAAAGVADFNDLIRWAKKLLNERDMAAWIRFKLDQRIDHLLVDEAQDTNADQWAIISSLVDDFFSGATEAGDRWRTLLMVGDFKQAIYRFQGTDPKEFEKVRAEFRERAAALAEAERSGDDDELRVLPFHDLQMATSYRSAQAVLDAVDAMIGVVGYEAMGLAEAPKEHRAAAHNAELPATVELWKPFAAQIGESGAANDDDEGWIDLRERAYAARLAEQVKASIHSAEVLGSTGKPVEPGDILILVRSRGELASLIVARLFEAGIPVAGIDRLHLQEPLAVQDLRAAMTFAVQPLDDLNLANLLVSPLIGWTQEQLFDLAAPRKLSLWPALRARANEGNASAMEARDALASLLAMADYVTPARFIETVLSGTLNGRRKLAQRLTMASRDPIDEFMASALDFEREDIPSLERFLAWFRRGDVEIARDTSAPTNEVRVMTVHGAKGLEAPVVIIADAHADPARLGRQNLPVEADFLGGAPVIRPRKTELVEPFTQAIVDDQKASLQEHFRLLYVGLTRAIDRLVIAGLEPRNRQLSADSWHSKMRGAMERLGADEVADPLWGWALRYQASGKPREPKARPLARTHAVAISDWARSPAPVEERPPRPLAPSAIGTDDEMSAPPSEAMRAAARRGTLIHSLLERLPGVAPADRRQRALDWLERSGGVEDERSRLEITDQVCAILSDPQYADLFGPNSLGEAPLAATLSDLRVVAGTVDRLLIEPSRVAVIDFKTGQAPASDESIPNSHRAQMMAYAEALKVIFPGRAIEASLLYTAGPVLFRLDA